MQQGEPPGGLRTVGEDIMTILCRTEMIFQPLFDTIMLHMAVDLVNKAKLAGHV